MRKLKPHLDRTLPHAEWNFDLEDRDKILRIDSEENIALKTIDLLKIHSFDCEELN